MGLKEYRVQRGMTQTELSERAGIRQSTISMYEKGNRTPNIENCGRLAKAYGQSIDFIFSLLDISK